MTSQDVMTLPFEQRQAWLTSKVSLHCAVAAFGDESPQAFLARALHAAIAESAFYPGIALDRIAKRASIKRAVRNPRAKRKPTPKPVWMQ